MNSFVIGVGVTSALFALIPSKQEEQWQVPWASIFLAVNAGVMFAIGLPH